MTEQATDTPVVAETPVFLCENRPDRPEANDDLPFDRSLYDEMRAYRDAIAGDCPYAQAYIDAGQGATYEDLIERCPEIMKEMHAKGAPKEINCFIALSRYAEATKD